MYLCRRCSPVILLTICLVIILSFMYHVTLEYVLVEDRNQRDDFLSIRARRHEKPISRLPRDAIEQESKEPKSELKTFAEFTESDQDDMGDPQALQNDTRNEMATEPRDVTEISAIRMTIIKDALNDLTQMTTDIQVNLSRYNEVVKSANNTMICNFYLEEGKLKRYSVPRVWSDTGYYYAEDVTLVTQITLEKLGTLSELLTHWPGPVSCSLYLDKDDMKRLPGFLAKFPRILQRENLDLHLSVKSGTLYPINYLRNLALNYSYTEYVLLMDVDFMPSHGLSEYLTEIIPTMHYLKKEVLVLPAMEFTSFAGIEFPKTKADLLDLWSLKIIVTSEEIHWPPSHRPTNYLHWRNATQPYKVEHIEGYEPYIIGRRDVLPRYNVSFLAGFRDKIVHILHVHALGLKFTVIPHHFAVHIPHNRETRPPFYVCSSEMYQDFLNLLIKQGSLKNQTVVVKPADEGPKPKKRVVRRVIRKVIRRRVVRKKPADNEGIAKENPQI